MPFLVHDFLGDELDGAGLEGLFGEDVGEIGEAAGEDESAEQVTEPGGNDGADVLYWSAFALEGCHHEPGSRLGAEVVKKKYYEELTT